jgi:tetratricopeptide (TPR) repeat protein
MKRLFIYLLTVVCIVSCSSGGGVNKTTSATGKLPSGENYKNGIQAVLTYEQSSFADQNSYKKALYYLKAVISAQKDNPDAWYNLGRVLFYHRDYKTAGNALLAAINYRPDFTEAYSLLIKTYLRQGNPDMALSVAENASNKIPNNAVVRNDMAIVLLKMDNKEKAADIARDLIKKNSKFTPAYVTLGNIYYIEGKLELARLIYLKALEIGETSGDLLTNLGIISMQLNDQVEALKYLDKAAKKSPQNQYVHLNLGKYYLDAGDYENASGEFKLALKLDPRMVEALVNVGIVFAKMKMFEKAKIVYEKAISYEPSFADAYFNYGILLSDYLNEPESALSMYNQFVMLKGNSINKKHKVFTYIAELQNKNKKGAIKK